MLILDANSRSCYQFLYGHEDLCEMNGPAQSLKGSSWCFICLYSLLKVVRCLIYRSSLELISLLVNKFVFYFILIRIYQSVFLVNDVRTFWSISTKAVGIQFSSFFYIFQLDVSLGLFPAPTQVWKHPAGAGPICRRPREEIPSDISNWE